MKEIQHASQHAISATAEDGSNSMREKGLEPICSFERQILSLARPDLTPRRTDEAGPGDCTDAQGHALNSVSRATSHPTSDVDTKPLLIAARLVRGPALRQCVECGKAISSAWPLRLTYRQGRTVFVAWVHPHTAVDDGQLPCAPDSPLVQAALGRGVDREVSTASTTDHGPATVRP